MGDIGEVLQVMDEVLFSSEKGPWLLVTAADRYSRWVHEKFDKDFDVEYLDK